MTVVETLGASAGVGRVLVDGEERGAVDLSQNILGAVAVVHVKIKHSHFLDAGRARGKGGDGDVVEVAKPHGSLSGGVMPGWAHKGEVGFAGVCKFQCAQGAANGASGVGVDVRIVGGVAIKHAGRMSYIVDVCEIMGGGDGFVIFGRLGFLPRDFDFLLRAQKCQCAGHALWSLRMAGLRVGKAAFIGDDMHKGSVGCQ